MRKASIFVMAALALLTAQCKKNEPKPEEKVMVPITGSVDFGGSKTEITTSGMINPVNGDKIYIYYGGSYAGCMTCTSTTGQQFSCSGTINTGCLGKTCTFMYLGSNNGINGETSSTISFADQKEVRVDDGKISGLEKFHVGSCQAQVSSEGTVTLPMATKMSIAYFQLTDGTNPIANQDVTISGVSATANINKTDGTLTGVTGDITVHTDDQGKFYMALVPQSGSVTFTFAVEGYENATNVFPNGIRECSFYSNGGSGDPLQVEVTSEPTPEFRVSAAKTVDFSPGFLYYDGSAFHFENVQCMYPNEGYNATHLNQFFWSKNKATAVKSGTNTESIGNGDVLFTNATQTTSNPDFQVDGQTGWRTLSKEEWEYLLGLSTPCRPDAQNLYRFNWLGNYYGLIILPDGTANPSTVFNNISSEADLSTYHAVFLPYTDNTDWFDYYKDVNIPMPEWYYWTSAHDSNNQIYYIADGGGHSFGVYAASSNNWRNCIRLVCDRP